MRKKQKRSGDRHGLQAVTLCISTALVLILLGLVVFSVLTARNLSAYVKQNIVVTMVLQDDMSSSEAQMFCSRLRKQPYINHLEYISKEQALKDGIKALGTDPREFTDINPFLSSVEITLKADYANNDSLMHITRELKSYPNVGEVKYQRDLVDKVNANIAKISIVLLALLDHQQHREARHIRAPLLHTHHEACGRVVGIHTPSVPASGCAYRTSGVHSGMRCARRMLLCPLLLRAGDCQCAHIGRARHNRRGGVFIGYSHHGVLCHTVGKQVPEDEGRRPLQDLNNS